ncbi:MAG: hypothetical protein COC12_09650 [Rhodobacteraceae bacterium]|nr:MAG: hypothetical protein COC12_09650 [Paracoccaceae bacterium]
MIHSFLETADHDGFAQGWFDGLNGQPACPRPELGPGMFDLEYLKHYRAAYADGHATATRERERREVLRAVRSSQAIQEHERDDN